MPRTRARSILRIAVPGARGRSSPGSRAPLEARPVTLIAASQFVGGKGRVAPIAIGIENIEEMRRREGIDDVRLRKEIRELRAGDLVKLTLLTGGHSPAGETVVVRITSIKSPALRGKLIGTPVSAGLAQLRVGARVAFTTNHIHSIQRRRSLPRH